MPHIVPWNEKKQLCRTPIQLYRTSVQQNSCRVVHIPDDFLDRAMEVNHITWSTATPKDQLTIFKLLEDIIAETMPAQINDEYFDKFVEIKEVLKWEI